MCERTCPCCGSKNHTISYGLLGTTIDCNRCGALLAVQRDPQAAPIHLKSDAEVDAWVEKGSGIVEGAESSNPKEDEMFGPQRFPVIGLAW